MSIEMFQFMDKQNAYVLSDALFAKANIRIAERIVKEVNESSTNKQLPSARLLYKLISTLETTDTDVVSRIDVHDTTIAENTAEIESLNESQPSQDEKLIEIETKLGETSTLVDELKHFTIQTVTGSIETVTDPSTTVFYLQRDDESDHTWMMYLYTESIGWVNVGDTEIDISHLWSKDETEKLKEALEIHNVEAIDLDRITAIIEQEFDNTEVTYGNEVYIERPSTTSVQMYDGAVKTPVWDNCDPNQLSISGDISATNAGVYEVTFTPKFGFRWADNSDNEDYTVSWTIDKSTDTTAPNISMFTVVGETFKNQANGSISGLTMDMEISTDGVIYDAVSTIVIENLSAGDYFIRYADNYNHVASDNTIITINEGEMIKVTFDANAENVTNMPSEQLLEYGTQVTEPEGLPINVNYTFKEWKLNTEDGETFDFSSIVTNHITLVATWVPIATATTSSITLGQSLADSIITNTSEIGGTWAWQDSTIVPTSTGTFEAVAIFRPNDGSAESYITLTVEVV